MADVSIDRLRNLLPEFGRAAHTGKLHVTCRQTWHGNSLGKVRSAWCTVPHERQYSRFHPKRVERINQRFPKSIGSTVSSFGFRLRRLSNRSKRFLTTLCATHPPTPINRDDRKWSVMMFDTIRRLGDPNHICPGYLSPLATRRPRWQCVRE